MPPPPPPIDLKVTPMPCIRGVRPQITNSKGPYLPLTNQILKMLEELPNSYLLNKIKMLGT